MDQRKLPKIERNKYNTYIFLGDRSDSGLHIDDCHKGRPNDSPTIDKRASPSQMEWSTLELAICQFAYNGNTIRPVKGNGSQIEDGSNSSVASQTNQIDEHTENAEQPNRVDRSVGPPVDLVPDSGKWKHFVTSISPDGTGSSLNSGHGREVENKEGSNGEEYATTFANDLVEDLRHRLVDHIHELLGRIAHTV